MNTQIFNLIKYDLNDFSFKSDIDLLIKKIFHMDKNQIQTK